MVTAAHSGRSLSPSTEFELSTLTPLACGSSFSFLTRLDPNAPPTLYPPLAPPFSAFLLGPDTPSRLAIAGNLHAFGASKIEFASSTAGAFSKDDPTSLLNAQYDFVLLDGNLVTKQHVQSAKKCQPKASVGPFALEGALRIANESPLPASSSRCSLANLPGKLRLGPGRH